MSRAQKVLSVLRLFDEKRARLKLADIVDGLRISQATAYRCVEQLLDAGLLESAGVGEYVLGPYIVELDRQIRIHDPLIAAADDVMRGLSSRTGGTVLLCRRHGLTVLCVHDVKAPSAPGVTGYERGRAMPLYRGATSKAVLANVNEDVLVRLVAHDAKGLAGAGLPTRLQALAATLRLWRASTVIDTTGEVNPAARGWAVPVFQGSHLLGSLSVILARDTNALVARGVADPLVRAALRIGARLQTA